VGAQHGENNITAIVTIYRERTFRKHLKILIDTVIIYYITKFKHSEISIFRNTEVTNIIKYQVYVIQV
jgi:hypothetical protein